ncbi:hypothetical protein AB2M62_03300 [Sphingomonas sp. MMS12-HWE2-04]|uniref:hypothetical protein n=1 Tax=Sphingomonas sp. MMS12-HWE2-04 TaxID=3234199 RepID=UPI00384BFF8D
MVQQRRDWNTLIRSIDRSRAPAARFFKPVCVIAAIDLADRGRLETDFLHPGLIEQQFSKYISPFFPDRADKGWQPLWFLSNDGLWGFSRKGKALDRKSFENQMPRTRKQLFDKFDKQAINPAYTTLWELEAARQELRNQMLLMLDGDAECRALIPPLLDPANFDHPEHWPDAEEVADYLRTIRRQPDMFAKAHEGARHASAEAAVAAYDALVAFKVDTLPASTPIGPEFRATGNAPIILQPGQSRAISAAQAELHHLLLEKCHFLQRGIPATSNRAAHIRQPLDKFTAALGSDPVTANGHVIWSHGNTLRRLNDADLRARASTNPDADPLPEQIGELLTDLVEQFNVYARQDPLLRELDHARIGPAGRAELLERLHAGRAVVEAARENTLVMAPEASNVLATATNAAEQAEQASGLNADQAIVNAADMQRNGARALMQSAVLEVKRWLSKSKDARKSFAEGALKQAGAETVKQLPFLKIVRKLGSAIREMWKGQDGQSVIERLLEWFQHLIP